MTLVTEYVMRVRSTDMDSDRIVNNAHYFEYFQEARLVHLHALGVIGGQRREGDPDRSFTLAETTCTYRSPLRYRDEIVVRAWTKEVRTRSFSLAYEIAISGSDTIVAQGSSAQVWLDQSGKPTPLPDVLRDALQASIDGPGS